MDVLTSHREGCDGNNRTDLAVLGIGIVVTNAVVLITFVGELREQGYEIYEALITGGRIRLRPILMTAITTSIALLPLAVFASDDGGIN